MITCLGLVVGTVTSADRFEVLKQCARFLDTHRYLLDNSRVCFEVAGEEYAIVRDTHDFEDGYLAVAFKMYDYDTEFVQVPRNNK